MSVQQENDHVLTPFRWMNCGYFRQLRQDKLVLCLGILSILVKSALLASVA